VNTEHFIYSDFQFVQEGNQHHEATSILGRLDKRHRRRRAVPVAAAGQSLVVMRLFAGFIPLAYNSGKERHPMNTIATKTIELPEELAAMLQAEAKRSRKTIAQYVAQWLEDQQDGREAAKVIKRIKEGKEKVYPAAEVWARHVI
jgi:predicted DNA-binding protein